MIRIKKQHHENTENYDKKVGTEANEGTIVNSLAGSLSNALDEEYDELQEEEQAAAETVEYNITKKAHGKAFMLVGIFTIILAFVGLISSIIAIVNLTEWVANKTALKEEFAAFVLPVVLTDPPPFEAVVDLPASVINAPAIWRILLAGDTSLYATADDGNLIIPGIDVEASARALFGYGFEITHKTIGDVELQFEYDEETKSYKVPANAKISSYVPVITNITNISELYTVTVGYVVPSALILAGDKKDEIKPSKTVIYTISRTGNGMTINSIKYVQLEQQNY